MSIKNLNNSKKINIIFIAICIFLSFGIVIICIIGEHRIRNTTKKNISNATEVFSDISHNHIGIKK